MNKYIPPAGIFLKNLFTALCLLGSMALLVTLVYIVQLAYYRIAGPGVVLHPAWHKIAGIGPDDVYDLSGSEASGNSQPMQLLDAHADPAHGINLYTPFNPLPRQDIFYPPGKGLRIVIDLHQLYALSAIYLYDRSPLADSIWLYAGQMDNWKPLLAYQTTGNAAGWGWKSFAVAASSRYLMIRFNSAGAMIAGLTFYGNLQQRLPPDTLAQLPPLTPPALAAFAGTNTYDYVPPRFLQPFRQTRLYQLMEWYDTDTVNAYPKNELALHDASLPPQRQLRYYADSLRRMGNAMWMSIRGMPAWMARKGFHEKDKPVTLPGMDTENPLSYGRHARTFWNLAAVFGATAVDTSLIAFHDGPRCSGLGLMDRFENGNEEDAYWTRYYWTPMEYFAISSADYDGHEGSLGPDHGLHQADIHSRLMMSGMIQPDTSRVRTLYFLCRQLRKDKKFIWEGGVQYHYYSNDAAGSMTVPTRGISPEADHMRQKLARVRAFHNRWLPGIPLILGENGYDRNQQSWQRTPLLPGYSADESQGILIIRSMLAAFMAGFDGYNQFMMRNATDDDNAPGVFATSGMIGGPASSRVYPAWYYWSAMMHHLGNYQADSILSESGPVWIYQLKHEQHPGQKAFILFCPTTRGTLIKHFRFELPGAGDSGFTIIRLADTDVLGNVQQGRFSKGIAELMVGEAPVMLVMDAK